MAIQRLGSTPPEMALYKPRVGSPSNDVPSPLQPPFIGGVPKSLENDVPSSVQPPYMPLPPDVPSPSIPPYANPGKHHAGGLTNQPGLKHINSVTPTTAADSSDMGPGAADSRAAIADRAAEAFLAQAGHARALALANGTTLASLANTDATSPISLLSQMPEMQALMNGTQPVDFSTFGSPSDTPGIAAANMLAYVHQVGGMSHDQLVQEMQDAVSDTSHAGQIRSDLLYQAARRNGWLDLIPGEASQGTRTVTSNPAPAPIGTAGPRPT